MNKEHTVNIVILVDHRSLSDNTQQTREIFKMNSLMKFRNNQEKTIWENKLVTHCEGACKRRLTIFEQFHKEAFFKHNSICSECSNDKNYYK